MAAVGDAAPAAMVAPSLIGRLRKSPRNAIPRSAPPTPSTARAAPNLREEPRAQWPQRGCARVKARKVFRPRANAGGLQLDAWLPLAQKAAHARLRSALERVRCGTGDPAESANELRKRAPHLRTQRDRNATTVMDHALARRYMMCDSAPANPARAAVAAAGEAVGAASLRRRGRGRHQGSRGSEAVASRGDA